MCLEARDGKCGYFRSTRCKDVMQEIGWSQQEVACTVSVNEFKFYPKERGVLLMMFKQGVVR